MPKPLARPRLPVLPGVGKGVNPPVEPSERAASLEPVEFSGLSMSMIWSPPALLLWRRWRFEPMVDDLETEAAPGPGVLFGGAAAMGMTPFPPTTPADEPALPWKLVGVLPAVFTPETPPLAGLSLSLPLPARCCDGGVVTWARADERLLFALTVDATERVEFFLVFAADVVVEAVVLLALFLERVLVPPTGRLLPEPRFRFLMTSVFKLRGRTTPWSLRKSPQALQSGWPSGFLRHSGVVCVKQFVQVVGGAGSPWAPAPCRLVDEPCLDPGGGDDGRLWATDE